MPTETTALMFVDTLNFEVKCH